MQRRHREQRRRRLAGRPQGLAGERARLMAAARRLCGALLGGRAQLGARRSRAQLGGGARAAARRSPSTITHSCIQAREGHLM